MSEGAKITAVHPLKMTGMLGMQRLQKAIGRRDLQVAYAFDLQETNLIFWVSNANPTNRM